MWPWPLTFWPQDPISSSRSPMTKNMQKSINRYWRYRRNIVTDIQMDWRTDRKHGQRHAKHIASRAYFVGGGGLSNNNVINNNVTNMHTGRNWICSFPALTLSCSTINFCSVCSSHIVVMPLLNILSVLDCNVCMFLLLLFTAFIAFIIIIIIIIIIITYLLTMDVFCLK